MRYGYDKNRFDWNVRFIVSLFMDGMDMMNRNLLTGTFGVKCHENININLTTNNKNSAKKRRNNKMKMFKKMKFEKKFFDSMKMSWFQHTILLTKLFTVV